MPVKPNFIPKILIIDDEPFNLEFLEVILKQYGYNIITANNGRTGRELAESQKPDLILLDIMMPGENGFECAAALRLSPETCETPIIFLTALDDAQSTSKGYDAGAVDFIVKPFEYKDVLQRIKTHLLISESEKQLLTAQRSSAIPAAQHPLPQKGRESVFPVEKPTSHAYVYETVILSEESEGHILINIPPAIQRSDIQELVTNLLAENTGPIYTPSTTVRNIGVRLKKILGDEAELSGIYIELDRENRLLTIVNAGCLPVIWQQNQKGPVLIERQSGEMGSLGLGLPPCKTFPINKGDRVFIFSNGMLSAFSSAGEAIIELSDACELSAGVDIETACQAAGEMLQKNEKKLDGILVAVEG